MKGIIRRVKQRFCKHDMKKTDTYEIKVLKDGKVVDNKVHEDWVCCKCGKKETYTTPKFIPCFKSIYNHL